MTICPICSGPLEPVRYPNDCMLNRDQWESQRAGDLLCRACPTYWWANGKRSEETSRQLETLKVERPAKPRNGYDVYAEIPADAERRTYWWDSGSVQSMPTYKIEYIQSNDPHWGWAVTENGHLNGWTKTPSPKGAWFSTESECLAHAQARLVQSIAHHETDIERVRALLARVDARYQAVVSGD